MGEEEDQEAFRDLLIGEGDRIGGLVVEDGLEGEVWAPRPGKGSCFHLVAGRIMDFDGEGGGGGFGLSILRASPEDGRVGGQGRDSSIVAARSIRSNVQ